MNEAENLPYVFKTLPDWIHEVVLVDGNSTDDTVEVARELWPDVKVVKQRGKGKGDALISGFAACTGDIIVMVDADGSADGQEIVSYVSALVSGADFAKGSRFANGGGTDDMTLDPQARQPGAVRHRQPQVRRPLHRPLLRLQRLLAPLPRRDRPSTAPASRSRP